MENIVFSASQSKTREYLSQYIDNYQINNFLSDFSKVKHILTETENFEVQDDLENDLKFDSKSDSKVLGLILGNSNYYINLKATTLLFACLLLDITYTKGLASTVLTLTGINFSVIKLTQEERHFLLRAKHIGNNNFNISAIKEKSFSTKQCFMCSNSNDNVCGLDLEKLTIIADTLVDKKILKKKGETYHYVL